MSESNGGENHGNQQERDYSVGDFMYIEELSKDHLTQISSSYSPGLYIIEDGVLRQLNDNELGSLDEEQKIVIAYDDGSIYYGDVSIEKSVSEKANGVKENNYYVSKDGEGVEYEKYGTQVYKGMYSGNSRLVGISYNNKEGLQLLFKGKHNVLPNFHDTDEAFICFAHNVSVGQSGKNTSLEEFDAIGKKYAQQYCYDLTEFDRNSGQRYNDKVEALCRSDTNNYADTKVFNFRLSDHGGEDVVRTQYIGQDGEVRAVREDISNKTSTARMKPLVEAIIDTIERSQQDEIIIRLQCQQCSGAMVGQDNENIIDLLREKLRDINKNITLYVEKAQEGNKIFTYNREYKDGTQGVGTVSNNAMEFVQYANNGRDVYTFGSKKQYRNALLAHKQKIGVDAKRTNLSGEDVRYIENKNKAKTIVHKNDREMSVSGYSQERVKDKNQEDANLALEDIYSNRRSYQNEKVDMSKFEISAKDAFILACLGLCLLFPLAVIYYDKLKQQFINNQRIKAEKQGIEQIRKRLFGNGNQGVNSGVNNTSDVKNLNNVNNVPNKGNYSQK